MTESTTGSARVKRGLAEMLKGGVIMDVVTPDQARIAEDAGAVAVMALERVPADIRAQGGVARMSDPDLIDACALGDASTQLAPQDLELLAALRPALGGDRRQPVGERLAGGLFFAAGGGLIARRGLVVGRFLLIDGGVVLGQVGIDQLDLGRRGRAGPCRDVLRPTQVDAAEQLSQARRLEHQPFRP